MECVGLGLLMLTFAFINAAQKSAQYAQEGQAVFSTSIERTRLEFLSRVVDISKADCNLVHFDGYHFCTPVRKLSCAEVYRIEVLEIKSVNIVNPSLPHYQTWKYQRIDGGPDRRYRGNEKLLKSRQIRIKLVTTTGVSEIVTTYSEYGLEVEKVVERFNEFLIKCKSIDVEGMYDKFARTYGKATRLSSRLGEIDGSLRNALKTQAVLDGMLRGRRYTSDMPKKIKQVSDDISFLTTRRAESIAEEKQVLADLDLLIEEMKFEFAYSNLVDQVDRYFASNNSLNDTRLVKIDSSAKVSMEQDAFSPSILEYLLRIVTIGGIGLILLAMVATTLSDLVPPVSLLLIPIVLLQLGLHRYRYRHRHRSL